MASLAAIRDAIKDTIEDNIEGLRVYDTIPDVTVVPAVVVEPVEASFIEAMARGTDRWEFLLSVLTTRAAADTGQDELDVYVTGAGTSSIRQVIFQNNTLGLTGTDAHVQTMTGYGGQFETASVSHVGAQLRLVVLTPGTS